MKEEYSQFHSKKHSKTLQTLFLGISLRIIFRTRKKFQPISTGICLWVFLQGTRILLRWHNLEGERDGEDPREQVHQHLAARRRLLDLQRRLHGPLHTDRVCSSGVRMCFSEERSQHHDEECHRCSHGRILLLDVWIWPQLRRGNT